MCVIHSKLNSKTPERRELRYFPLKVCILLLTWSSMLLCAGNFSMKSLDINYILFYCVDVNWQLLLHRGVRNRNKQLLLKLFVPISYASSHWVVLLNNCPLNLEKTLWKNPQWSSFFCEVKIRGQLEQVVTNFLQNFW